MAKKTDILKKKRCRVKFDCKPQLKYLLIRLNLFPILEEWKDFEGKNEVPVWVPDLKYYEERIRRGVQLLEYLRSLSLLASKIICSDADLQKAFQLEEQRRSYERAQQTANKLADHNSDEYKVKILDNYKEQEFLVSNWLFAYKTIKFQKQVLSRLSFIGRNPENANKDLTDLLFWQPVGLFYNFHIDSNKFQKKDNGFLEALTDIDITRIRECRICRKFFWANRKDKQGCSEKCANILNQRNLRENKRQKGLQYKEAESKTRKRKLERGY